MEKEHPQLLPVELKIVLAMDILQRDKLLLLVAVAFVVAAGGSLVRPWRPAERVAASGVSF